MMTYRGGMARRTAEESREAIVSAARAEFASAGYEGATIRAIAARAAIDPAMVIRYFGSKRALFAASVEVDLRVDGIEVPAVREHLGEALVRHVISRWEGDHTLRILLRTGLTDDAFLARVRDDIAAGQIAPFVERVGAPAHEVPLRTALVGSQALGLMVLRFIARVEPIASASIDELVSWYSPTFQRYLTGPLDRTGPLDGGES